MRSILLSILIAGTLLVCSSCDNESGNTTTAIDRDYTLTLLGKTVTVTDTRTGAADKNLEALGVMEKLRGASLYLDGIAELIDTAPYDRVLAKGMIIIVEIPTVPYERYKTKDDGKTMMFNIAHISDPEVENTAILSYIADAVENYLDKGIEKLE